MAFGVGYLMSGSVMVGGAIALVEATVNTVVYHHHEQLWHRLPQHAAPDSNRRTA